MAVRILSESSVIKLDKAGKTADLQRSKTGKVGNTANKVFVSPVGQHISCQAVISAAADKSARIPRHFLLQTKGAHCRFPFVAFGIVFACP